MTIHTRDITELEHAEQQTPGTLLLIQTFAATIAASLLNQQAASILKLAYGATPESDVIDAANIIAAFATRVATAIHRELNAAASPRPGDPTWSAHEHADGSVTRIRNKVTP